MNNRLEQMMTEILEKKFSISLRSGYDPEDVDQFFDYIISYLTNVNVQISSLGEERNTILSQIKVLNDQIEKKNQAIEMLQREISDLKNDGYGNQRIAEKIKKLEEQQENLKK